MKFNIILSDPAWEYKDKCSAGKRGAEYKYPVMSIEDIKSLPVASLAAEDCILFMWATFPLLQEALDVIKAWGFKYKTIGFVWVKKNKKKDTYFTGLGHYTRANSELCLLATKGKPKRISAAVHSIIDTPIEKHSKKPAIIRDKIIELVGDKPRIELFSRERVDGWVSLGYDIDGRDIRESINDIIKT